MRAQLHDQGSPYVTFPFSPFSFPLTLCFPLFIPATNSLGDLRPHCKFLQSPGRKHFRYILSPEYVSGDNDFGSFYWTKSDIWPDWILTIPPPRFPSLQITMIFMIRPDRGWGHVPPSRPSPMATPLTLV